MRKLSPVSRHELIRKPKVLDCEGPFPGGKHQWMRKGRLRVMVPNPHGGDIDPALIRRILQHLGIAVEEWNEA
ncbi:MAG TPA: type II toxin-antitoxin system HicA family toxin [Candidatus Fraserbacteria bacterium]|nr:type II toxin-antitoxin system HicA family toxin [Candidatus Fraserbacteria bacterium]